MENLFSESVSDSMGLYIHVPFCRSRCIYCDFVSYTDFSKVEEYFEALWKELKLWSEHFSSLSIDTIYIGGGSPSDVPFNFLERTLSHVQNFFSLKNDPEVTVEINPNCEFVEKLKLLGVNRVSIGLQAADETVLRRAGRRHSLGDFFKAFERARNFAKMNVDFIVGLPGESEETINNDIRTIEELKPDHVSIYLLEVHEKRLETPSRDVMMERYERFVEATQSMGYFRYEISNFALNDKFCRHNLKYWRNENYLGVGVSAGGHLGNIRYVNTPDLHDYVLRISRGELAFEYFSRNDTVQELKETIFMGLRLSEGVSVRRLKKICPWFDPNALFSDLFGELLELHDDRLRLTKEGFDRSCEVLADVIDRISSMAVGR
ncbi:radical SAM family heme chaperone HemW [Pseudothermotoga sp.]